MQNIYDVIIIGGGPAGLTAGIYACRSGLKTLLLEEYVCGGQTINTYEIKNYPAYDNISGVDLSLKMQQQATKLGLEIIYSKAVDFDFNGQIKVVKTAKTEYFCKTVILAMGAGPNKLMVKGEQQFTGRGVSYCAVCDGEFFKDKTVAIVGGGNSAMEDVAYLTKVAKKTYLINRTEKYRALPVLVSAMQKLASQNKIQVLNNTVVKEICGNQKLEKIVVENTKTLTKTEIVLDGLFVEIGRKPSTEIVKKYVATDEYGYIITDENLMTNQSGVFAVGDIRQKTLRQIITACGDGALGATNAQKYISEREW
ncbi:MAG: NAD(P)/FAD-dependent oxidoreductase [Christensenellales bacterium]